MNRPKTGILVVMLLLSAPALALDGTTIDANSAAATTCNLITTTSMFSEDDNGDGSTEVQFNTVNSFPGTVACAGSSGPSPRQCLIPGLLAGQDYWLQFHYVDSDGVSAGAAPQDEVIGPVNTGACAGDGLAPMILPLAPSGNAIIGGVDTVKLQVFDSPIGSVTVVWSVDGGATNPAILNGNYDCGTDCAVFEFELNTTTVGINPQSLDNGSHYLTIAATDADGHTTDFGYGIRVNNVGDRAAGSGMLLRRTHGSQLCIDCHNLPTHSSQSTSSKYGNWAIGCTVCHTPHRTTNIYLVDGAVETPNSGSRPVRFETLDGAVADSSIPGTASYVNEDNATQVDGVCQACHTRTANSSGDARWRNADSGGNLDSHYDSSGTSRCTACHTHDAGFSGAGAGCLNCHTGTEGGALGDGTPNAVDDQWSSDGHGSGAGGSMTSSLDGCDYCHQLDAAHTPTAGINPYRLRVGTQDTGGNPAYDFGSTPGNRLCLACHETGDAGVSRNSNGDVLTAVNGSANVNMAHFGAKHQQPEGGELCWDCHDPHGVPVNILMVKSQVSKSSDAYGVPITTVTVTFTDNSTPGQAVGRFTENTNTPRQGICQACHDPDSGNGNERTTDGPTKYWRSDGTDDRNNTGGTASTHQATKLCTNCHPHTNGFSR